ncbi:MAG TPA: hypothetical protein VHV47_02500 [Opitutaceae bacterium]|nr:hypothetical protein [Opitutaceae bacterium]
MGKPLLTFALLLALAGLLAHSLMRQHLAGQRLRAQLTTLQAQAELAAELKRENARLRAGQASPEELSRLRRQRTAAARGREDEPAGAAGDRPRLTADQWRLAGRATPADAFESVLWASTHQDVDALAGILSFDPKARKKVDGFFAALPEDTRQKFGSPERIVATMLAANMPSNLSAMDALGTTGNDDRATLLMRVERNDGTQKDNFFKFEHVPDGWKLIVPPQVLQGYASQLTGKEELPSASTASASAPGP